MGAMRMGAPQWKSWVVLRMPQVMQGGGLCRGRRFGYYCRERTIYWSRANKRSPPLQADTIPPVCGAAAFYGIIP